MTKRLRKKRFKTIRMMMLSTLTNNSKFSRGITKETINKFYRRVGSLGVLLLLLLSGCVSTGYHNRTLLEAKDASYRETLKLAQDVRDKKMSIYEMIRALKDRRFARKI